MQTYNSFILTHKGTADIAKKEISEALKIPESKISAEDSENESILLFDSSLEDLCKLAYLSRTAIKVCLLLSQIKIDSVEDLKKVKINTDLIKKSTKFAVRSKVIGHNIKSEEINSTIGMNISAKVDLESPDIMIYAYINKSNCYITIDLAGFDLSKRDYKLLTHHYSLKGTIAHSLLRMIDYGPKDSLLNPFCRDGSVAIEAALCAINKSPHYYKKDRFMFKKIKPINAEKIFSQADKQINEKAKADITAIDDEMSFISSAKKNSKVANAHKLISFSKISIDWYDVKFKKAQFSKIIAYVPSISKNKDEKSMAKFFNDFFYQCEYTLNKAGLLLVLASNLSRIEESAEKNKFRLKESREIYQGEEKLKVLVFMK